LAYFQRRFANCVGGGNQVNGKFFVWTYKQQVLVVNRKHADKALKHGHIFKTPRNHRDEHACIIPHVSAATSNQFCSRGSAFVNSNEAGVGSLIFKKIICLIRIHDNLNPFLGMSFNEKEEMLILWKFCSRYD
jgi:hypothetical protein